MQQFKLITCRKGLDMMTVSGYENKINNKNTWKYFIVHSEIILKEQKTQIIKHKYKFISYINK